MRGGKVLCVAAATLALGWASASAAMAETRALLIGVADYVAPQIPDLKGPNNDVPALKAMLEGEGATDIVVLRDADASRTNIEKALHDLGRRAKAGDWVVVYYSGHGAQAVAADTGDEDDGLDEFLVLSGFDAANPNPEWYITDNDFYAWFSRYFEPDVEVLQIADACHSGTLNRSIDPRAWNFTPRLAFPQPRDLQLARPAPKFESLLVGASNTGTSGEAQDLRNVTFIGAAQDDQLALEASVPVQGAPSRGLLTYAFEHGLSLEPGQTTLAADADGDGKVTVAELGVYLDSQVRLMTGQRQKPTTHFAAGAENEVVFKTPPPSARPPAPPAPPPLPAVYVADARGKAAAQGETLWRMAATPQDADFVWDFASGQVLRRSGDVVARDVKGVQALKGVVGKWDAVEALGKQVSEGRAHVVVGPKTNGARYAPGERVNVAVSLAGELGAQARGGYATVFNLASDGEVQLLYPLKDDGEGRLASDGSLPLFNTVATAPYGADHVVALITPQKPDALRGLLGALDGQRDAPQAAAAVSAELKKAGAGAALSIGELYTGG